METPRLAQQVQFLAEMDKVKRIVRRTYLADSSRYENDAEHSWHMAVWAMVTAEYAPPEIDLCRVLRMCLLHDVVEIDAGDSYIYDPAALVGKEDREQKAAERIFGLLPADQAKEFRALWEEFEHVQTPDAKFAAALDRVQSLYNNYLTSGRSWSAHGVRVSQVMHRMAPVREGAPGLWNYVRSLIEQAHANGWLKDG
jgi:putative hydrolase of HD superfamily